MIPIKNMVIIILVLQSPSVFPVYSGTLESTTSGGLCCYCTPNSSWNQQHLWDCVVTALQIHPGINNICGAVLLLHSKFILEENVLTELITDQWSRPLPGSRSKHLMMFHFLTLRGKNILICIHWSHCDVLFQWLNSTVKCSLGILVRCDLNSLLVVVCEVSLVALCGTH